MTAVFPSLASSYDASTWDGADGSVVSHYVSGLTNGNKLVSIVAQGASPDDILRLEFPNLTTISVGDTITVSAVDKTLYTTMAFLPYDASTTVDATNRLTLTALDNDDNSVTLTQAFIDDLFDQGSGTWAVRVVEDGAISGNIEISEVNSNLTTTGGGGSPGGQPGNAPQNYKYLKNHRLTNSSAFGRMPKSEREWSAFIHELNKWIKDETGTFDISSTDDAKFTGFSTDPTTSSIWWHRYGQFVHLEFNIGTGTSDATDFTITGIPEVITPRDACTQPLFGLYDNGGAIVDRGSVKIGSDGVITFYSDHQDGTWTGGGTVKGFEAGLGAKCLIYDLRNPNKQ